MTKVKVVKKDLWNDLQEHFQEFIYNNDLSFVKRLARENGWSVSFAEAVTLEYQKFVYLMMTAPHPVTPSDEVDQAWHLHLQYSRNYENMCKIYGKFLHHEPTKGGKEEDDKFDNWYEKTLQTYLTTFMAVPPVRIWPPAEVRFNKSPKAIRVNYVDNFIISKKLYKQIKNRVYVGFVFIILGFIWSIAQSLF